jgi:hypothetical protein
MTLDIESSLPVMVVITEWKVHDSKKIKDLTANLRSWDVVVMDKWYISYQEMFALNQRKISFVTRKKENMKRHISWEEVKPTHPQVQRDIMIELEAPKSYEKYSQPMRLIHYIDETTWTKYEFLTNDFESKPEVIWWYYKKRWEIELFFKRIKQNLKIKSFYWTSKNAVYTQLRISLIYYLLLCIMKLKTSSTKTLHQAAVSVRSMLFQKIHIFDIFSNKKKIADWRRQSDIQKWSLFDRV